MAEIRKSRYLRNRSTDRDEILYKQADFDCKPCVMLKFAYFTNLKWRATAILKMENLQYLRNRLSDRDEI